VHRQAIHEAERGQDATGIAFGEGGREGGVLLQVLGCGAQPAVVAVIDGAASPGPREVPRRVVLHPAYGRFPACNRLH
jgi:hypothetical protein